MIDLLNSVEFIAAASGFHYGLRWHQELLERNEIAGDSRPNRSAADGLFRKTWPSQPDNWEMKPRNRDCKSANANCQTAATTGNRRPQSPCSAPKFVRQHIAIVIAAHQPFSGSL